MDADSAVCYHPLLFWLPALEKDRREHVMELNNVKNTDVINIPVITIDSYISVCMMIRMIFLITGDWKSYAVFETTF